MPTLTLNDDPFVIQTPDGASHTIADPLEMLLGLTKEKLIGADGTISQDAESLSKIRDNLRTVTGISTLTYAQAMAVVVGVSNFTTELQKKIASTQTSSPSTDTSQTALPNASAST